MNPIPMLRERLEAVPFEPFQLCLTNGRKLPVHHPDFLAVTRHRIIWEGETEDEFAIAMPLHVVGIEQLPPRRRRKRAA